MISILDLFSERNQIDGTATYDWLKKESKKTIKNLEKTINPARAKLILFLSEQNASILNIEKIADLIVDVWVRGLQIYEMLESINFEYERDLLNKDIENGKKWIKSLERLSSPNNVGMKTIFNLDLKLAPDVEQQIRSTQEKIDYFESILSQSFHRKDALDKGQIKKLLLFTMFYIGEEILRMEQAKKPRPLYRFINILYEINTGKPFDGNSIYNDHIKYTNVIKNCLENPIEGERYDTKYSFTPYKDGWKCIGINQLERTEYFIETKVNFYEVNLLKFIYTMKIPDHILTMYIFDYKSLSEIISILDNK